MKILVIGHAAYDMTFPLDKFPEENTEIQCFFEEEASELKPCKLPTKLLREIVAAWLEEFEKYRNSKK